MNNSLYCSKNIDIYDIKPTIENLNSTCNKLLNFSCKNLAALMFGAFMEYRFDIDKVRATILAIDSFESPEKLPELIELINYHSVFLAKAYNTTLEISKRLDAEYYFNYSVWAFMTAGPAFIAAEQQEENEGFEWQLNFLNALSRVVLENINKVLASPLVPGQFPEHWIVSLD